MDHSPDLGELGAYIVAKYVSLLRGLYSRVSMGPNYCKRRSVDALVKEPIFLFATRL